MFKNPIICAADTKDVDAALALTRNVAPHVGAIKLGLEFFTSNGMEGVRAIAKAGLPIFLDLKFYDIPNTVSQAVYAATEAGIHILTIHTSGGSAMMKAASEAAHKAAKDKNIPRPLVVGVTVLTSMDNFDLEETGISSDTNTQVKRLARLAKNAGLDGVVCSAHEIKLIKSCCGENFKTVVPGIRPRQSQSDDQKRVTTPNDAISKGADFLVIGRPITKSEAPSDVAKSIAASLG